MTDENRGGRAQEPYLESKPRRRRRARDDHLQPEALSDLMLPMFAKLGLKTRARWIQINALWPGVVGAGVAAETTPAQFARGRLTVETTSPALSHQLHLQRMTIVKGLNDALHERVVSDIYFRLRPGLDPKAPGSRA
jgi:hypothetical protein